MTSRLAGLTLRLYPLAFRRRYGEELRAWFEEVPPSTRDVFDLLCSALVTHLRPPRVGAGLVSAGERVRASASGVLACWVAFVAAGFAFYKTTEDAPFTSAGEPHALLGARALGAVQMLALVGSAAVLLGAAPLVVAAAGAGASASCVRAGAGPPAGVGGRLRARSPSRSC